MPAESNPQSISSQPWAQAPESRTDTGPAFQPDPDTRDFLRGIPAEHRTMCRGPEGCGHPEWHRLAELPQHG